MVRVTLIFGGMSPEHEVSLVSARYVCGQLKEAGFEVSLIGIDREGQWHIGNEAFHLLSGRQAQPYQAAITPGRDGHRQLAALETDVVFPMIHGLSGEDGCIQGYCELAGIPYVGGDLLNQSLCWDKLATRIVLSRDGIPQPQYRAFFKGAGNRESAMAEVAQQLGFPLFVKPSRAGSSIGISKVYGLDELGPALDKAFEFDYRVVVEQGLDAREIEVAGLGAGVPLLSIPAEIVAENDFYDFQEKYLKSTSKFIIPAELEPGQKQRMERFAKRAWLLLNCYGMARIDFLVTEEEVYLNEINTFPGFTSISLYPKLLAESGVAPPEIMCRLVNLALEKKSERGVSARFESKQDWFREAP